MRQRSAVGLIAVGVASVLLLGACGSGSARPTEPSAADTVQPLAEPDTSLAEAPPVDTDAPESTTTGEPIAETTVGTATVAPLPQAVEPLTGLPATAGAPSNRPALIVKIDGHSGARPQFGLDRADIVIEEIVEGITRFMAVYHSEVPEVIGPVRSARTQDMLIAPMFVRPLFAWSGGNRKVIALVKDSPVVNIAATSTGRVKGLWYRTKKRKAPHNLLTRGRVLLEQAQEDSQTPPAIFGYRPSGTEIGGREVSGAKLVLSSSRVVWLWDEGVKGWLRTSDRTPHTAEGGAAIAPANVVVLEVRYQPSPADPNSPEAQTIGTGKALVFTGGRLIVGTWSRDDVNQPWALADKDGKPILLTAGQTWVELARASRTAIIDVGVDPSDVPYRTK